MEQLRLPRVERISTVSEAPGSLRRRRSKTVVVRVRPTEPVSLAQLVRMPLGLDMWGVSRDYFVLRAAATPPAFQSTVTEKGRRSLVRQMGALDLVRSMSLASRLMA